MRKVLFKKWIPKQYAAAENKTMKPISGTGCFEPEFKSRGMFHQWAAKSEEYESGPGNYTVAIVETETGEVAEVLPTNIKFVNVWSPEK